MLLANRRVAEFVYNIKIKDKHPVFLYRTHDKPEKSKVLEFIRQAKKFGITIDDDLNKYPFTLNKLFDDIKNDPEKSILSTFAVRTMQRAEYTTLPQGHYGLAFEHYTHFTSPIRRYVDVMVHRLLKKYLRGEYIFDPYGYEKMCQYANERESLAFFAERESIKFKQVESLQAHVGEKVKGTISGLTDFGIFVELNESKCDGLIRFADYKDDYLIFDRVHNVVYGKYTGNQFEIGNQLDVIIDKCDIEKRLLNLRFY
jgi:ribonuclease R